MALSSEDRTALLLAQGVTDVVINYANRNPKDQNAQNTANAMSDKVKAMKRELQR